MGDPTDDVIDHLYEFTPRGIHLLNAHKSVRHSVFLICRKINLATEAVYVSAVIALIWIDEKVTVLRIEATKAMNQKLKIHAIDAGL